MTNLILITISILILVAYVFDISASKTRIPSVILLIIVGWIVGQLAEFLNLHIPDLNPVLPVLGTMGLILIVLEGSLDLKLTRQKRPVILKSFFSATISIALLAVIIAFIINKTLNFPFIYALINVTPLCIISSAIAIPSVRNLNHSDRDFIIYESSFSDIIGIVIFNALLMQNIGKNMLIGFVSQITLMLVISFIVTLLLFYLLTRIQHSIKFTPIIFSIILIYSISKFFHLPALILVFIFGLFLNNIFHFNISRMTNKFDEKSINKEINKFRDIVSEGSFIIRALFFLLFGFLIKNSELVNVKSLQWTFIVLLITFIVRYLILKIFRLKIKPLLFVAPRGLISILLFLMIPSDILLSFIDKSIIIQVILLTSFIMMIGIIVSKKDESDVVNNHESDTHKDLVS